jgi:quinoprotein glucose dehydrogenase
LIKPFAVLLWIISAILIAGGGDLVVLGGSPYYLAAGCLLTVCGVLLWRHRRLGAWLYALFLLLTSCWAIWEVGFDGWALLPRLAGPVVLGLWLLLPPVRRALSGDMPLPHVPRGALLLAGGVIACGLGASAHLLRHDAPDPIYQTGVTRFTDRLGSEAATSAGSGVDWANYGGDPGGSKYSTLTQLTPANVGGLKPAWTFHLGAAQASGRFNLELTPIKIADLVYACTATNDVVAIDAETGAQRWRFDAHTDAAGLSPSTACRGVAYYREPGARGACAERIITNTVDARLIALDARDGHPCRDFGHGGVVSLLPGMGKVVKGYYYVSSAPTVVRGKVVLGGWVSDGQYWGEPSGVVRAFDAVTGNLSWAFDMGRPDRHGLPPPGEQYTLATPNSWAPMSADETLGLVYVPTGNATPDYYGAQRRPFDDRYSSSVLAIEADTGKVRWSFQTTHHDLWDYDVPSQPTLADIRGPRGIERLLVQATKRGELFVLDRATGRPLAATNEHPVPQGGTAPGERLSPTQPFSDGMPSTRGPALSERMMWGLTPLDQLWCRLQFRKSRFDGTMTPPGLDRPNIVYPGYAGGSNWGGVTIDLDRGILLTNSLRMANRAQLMTRAQTDAMGVFPLTVETGRSGVGGAQPQRRTPYGVKVAPFLSPLGMPCQQPPYGMISGIDLTTHKLIWTRRLGTARDSGPIGIPSMLPIPMGVPNFGGAVATRGGLTFIAATQDLYLRGFDTRTGDLVWQGRLPAGGQATPITYLSPRSGRQFVLIAAGGHTALATRSGDEIVAYALPR